MMTIKYPIAELFHSVQGEGFWTGTPMMFVRLAGCNVGKYEPRQSEDFVKKAISMGVSEDKLLVLEGKHSFCTTHDGQRFLCDTDYHRSTAMSIEELGKELYEHHVCVTGGEPFLHDLSDFEELGVAVHIETSGTKPIKGIYPDTWITCCPKEGFLDENAEFVDEWKFLVGEGFSVDEASRLLSLGPLRPDNVYIQPINGVNEISKENMQRCFDLLKLHPDWKLSAQLHKYLEVR